jgi:hypothetical protein
MGLRNMKNIKEMTEAMIKVNSIENQADVIKRWTTCRRLPRFRDGALCE